MQCCICVEKTLDAFYLFDECYNLENHEKFFLSDKLVKNTLFLGAKVLGGFSFIKNNAQSNLFVYQCGNFNNVHSRNKWFNIAIKHKLFPLSLLSPLSYIHKTAKLGEGCIIYPGVKIMRNVTIGKNCIILPNSIINHGTSIGDFSIINSSVTLNGDVSIGERSYIGSGCIVRENLKVSDFIKIGMGSLVTKDLDEIGVYYGSPAKKIYAYNWSGE